MYDLEQTLTADAWNDLLERLHDAVPQLTLDDFRALVELAEGQIKPIADEEV